MATQAEVAVIEMEPPAPVEHGGEVQLPAPVGDDGVAEETLGPAVHFVGDLFGDLEKERVPGQGELEVAVVVQGHGVHLAQGVLAVEHPAVGPGQQGVGDVADAGAHPGAGLGGRSGALDPLAGEVGGDDGAVEVAGPGVLDGEAGARDQRVRVQERDGLAPVMAGGPAQEPVGHQFPPAPGEGGQGFQGRDGLRGVEVGVTGPDA